LKQVDAGALPTRSRPLRRSLWAPDRHRLGAGDVAAFAVLGLVLAVWGTLSPAIRRGSEPRRARFAHCV